MKNCRSETPGNQFRDVNLLYIYILPQNAGNACNDVIHSTYARMVRPPTPLSNDLPEPENLPGLAGFTCLSPRLTTSLAA